LKFSFINKKEGRRVTALAEVKKSSINWLIVNFCFTTIYKCFPVTDTVISLLRTNLWIYFFRERVHRWLGNLYYCYMNRKYGPRFVEVTINTNTMQLNDYYKTEIDCSMRTFSRTCNVLKFYRSILENRWLWCAFRVGCLKFLSRFYLRLTSVRCVVTPPVRQQMCAHSVWNLNESSFEFIQCGNGTFYVFYTIWGILQFFSLCLYIFIHKLKNFSIFISFCVGRWRHKKMR